MAQVFRNRLAEGSPYPRLESNVSSYIQSDEDNNYLWNWVAPWYGGWDNIPPEIVAAYDTYSCTGLPAGPVSNPGLAAIRAALDPQPDPEAEDAYFFVTDLTGRYYYAHTLANTRQRPHRPGRQRRAVTCQTQREEHHASDTGTAGPRRGPGTAALRRLLRGGRRLLRPARVWDAGRARQLHPRTAGRGGGLRPRPGPQGLPDPEHPAHQRGGRPDARRHPGGGAAGVDAFIVADLGVLDACKTWAPDVDVHMSTQTGITSYAAATACWKMGAKRVVLARELSLTDIAMIRDKTPPELEAGAFVHGAMCMSVSGRCLLSNYLAGRDANRGQCAQPCR